MKIAKIAFFLLLLVARSYSQGKIYFFNKTGRPVWIQRMTITGVGSFSYVLDSVASKIQYIPIDTKGPAILNVMVVPERGPYGTADGIYYLFKKDDTVSINQNEKKQPLVSHNTSAVRTKELAFALKLLNHTGVTPFYTLEKTNPQLHKTAWSADLKKRGKIIDSLSRPYINSVRSLCASESIEPEIGELYYHHYTGAMISDKLFLGYGIDSSHLYQLNQYYKDSLIKWMAEMNCRNCENIPFYNIAMKGVYRMRYAGVRGVAYLDTVSALTKGYAKEFLLSNYLIGQIESAGNSSTLLSYYDRLSEDTLYKRMVHDNYSLHRVATKAEAAELAVMMKADRSKMGFNQLISSLRGKVVYIDFWASWCKPCVEEIPFSHTLRERLAGKNVSMLYISLDTDFESWRNATEKYNLKGANSFVLTNPEKSKLSKKINLGPIPRYLVIDKTGKIVKLDASRPSDEGTYSMLLKLAGEQ